MLEIKLATAIILVCISMSMSVIVSKANSMTRPSVIIRAFPTRTLAKPLPVDYQPKAFLPKTLLSIGQVSHQLSTILHLSIARQRQRGLHPENPGTGISGEFIDFCSPKSGDYFDGATGNFGGHLLSKYFKPWLF